MDYLHRLPNYLPNYLLCYSKFTCSNYLSCNNSRRNIHCD